MDISTLLKRKTTPKAQKRTTRSEILDAKWMIRWMQEMGPVIQEFAWKNRSKKRKKAREKKKMRRILQNEILKRRRMTMRRRFSHNNLHREGSSSIAQPSMHIRRVEASLEIMSWAEGNLQRRGQSPHFDD
ncbi:hypothetical protein Godav_010009 [Gossypium davidsonii]|uniref:Uncharacterized protein n=1 Tax=Gossypium davidsonii TaxID=34287 RepID=A0A7J8SF66_GOSDV|nr:hypothetical protein [Gossypium davidsonii]